MPKTAYLTIDDAPSTDFMTKLEALESHAIKAVWFCEGRSLDLRPEPAIEAVRRGHIIANHSYSHPNFSHLALNQCYAEIRAADALIEEVYHRAGVPRRFRYFRFPYGDKGDGRHGNNIDGVRDADGEKRHDAIQGYLRKLGYTLPPMSDITYAYYDRTGLRDDADWYWTYDTHDWCMGVENPPHGLDTLDNLLRRMEDNLPENLRGLNYPDSADIVLMHDHVYSEPVFMTLLNRLLAKGVQFKLPV